MYNSGVVVEYSGECIIVVLLLNIVVVVSECIDKNECSVCWWWEYSRPGVCE